MAKASDIEREEEALHRRVKVMMEAYRTARGWGQAEMAIFLGLTRANYQKYAYNPPNKKVRKVPTIVVGRFCKHAGIDLEQLIFGPSKSRKAG